ncbi:MAG: adenine phosphoribosyltransferase [Bacteroidia bacterium]|nr:adenine phosphoribosyltransferase [Bacteroidia bacterium]
MSIQEELSAHIRAVPDFPIPGILFRDISPIFLQPRLVERCSQELATPWMQDGITKVVGVDSRGFLLGPQIAGLLNAGFVMVRKAGKLPPETVSVSYELEYGKAVLESVKDSIIPGDVVLIHDDLLATGGTSAAAANLATQLGAQVVGFCFLVGLPALSGQKNLLPYSNRIQSLIDFGPAI